MHFKGAILEILDETLDNHHGHYLDKGTSLFETLATITAAEASLPVSASCASIAAQVNHIAFYLDVLRGAIEGTDPGKVDWNEAWSIGPVDEGEWTELVGRLRASSDATIAVLKAIEVWDEDPAYGPFRSRCIPPTISARFARPSAPSRIAIAPDGGWLFSVQSPWSSNLPDRPLR
jgi:hypothetical protein